MNKSNENLKSLLNGVETIAIIGVSQNSRRDSNKVMKYLIERGYEVFPINPYEKGNKIHGKKCYSHLREIKEKIDMIDIFRASEHVLQITQDALKAGIKIIWTQEGIIDHRSATLAKNSGVTFVMNECPKKVLEN